MPTLAEEIKSRLDIVDLIQEYTPLKQSGANFKALCPFHSEKTPSFMVSREKQFFKCFGCGLGGDIFTFLQKMENIEFPEALKILADKAGVRLRYQSYDPQFQNLKTRLYNLLQVVTDFYHDQFLNSPAARRAREYLINTRGLNKNTLVEFQIGYAPESWDVTSKFLKSKGFSDNEIRQSGLVVDKSTLGPDGRSYYDRFRDRIMFPIHDYHGNIIGFTGRTLKSDEEAKYINTPQTIIYNKSQVLYGLHKAKIAIKELARRSPIGFDRGEGGQALFVILVEGNMDVIASYQAGVKNVVASSGTSLTLDQIRILKRYTQNLALAFDMDAAGIAAAERGIELAWHEGMSVKVIILPSGIKDPDELIKKSKAAWQEAVDKRINFMDYLLEINMVGQDLTNVDVKRSVTQKIIPWLAKLANPIEQDHYLKVLASKLNVSENSLREALSKIRSRRDAVNRVSTNQTPDINQKINKYEIVSQRLLALILYSPEYIKATIDRLPPELIEQSFQEFYKEIIFYYTKSDEFSAKGGIDDFYEQLKAERKDLAFVFDTLKLLAESEFINFSPTDLNKEFNLTINFLKKENISERLKKIEQEIKSAEQAGEWEKVDELMREFSKLSRELANL